MSLINLARLSFCLFPMLIGASAQTAGGLRAARGSAQTTDALPIAVNNRFSDTMAKRANLSLTKPLLSSDGVRGGKAGNDHVASAECLLAETVARTSFGSGTSDSATEGNLDRFCASTTEAITQEARDRIRGQADERAGFHMDDAVIHIVSWRGDQTRQGAWYHYHRAEGGWTGNIIGHPDPVRELTEIMGSKNVAFLAIHLNVDDSCKIEYKFDAKHTKPINEQNLGLLIKTAIALFSKGAIANVAQTVPEKPKPAILGLDQGAPEEMGVGVWGGTLVLAMPELPAQLTWTGSVGGTVKKVDANNKAADGFAVENTCPTKAAEKKPDAAQSSAASEPIPSNLVASLRAAVGTADEPKQDDGTKKTTVAEKPKLAASDDQSLSATVINEGLHRWDVSVGMPVKNHKSVKLESDSLLLVPKEGNDITPYALIDLYPMPADLQTVSLKTKRFIITPPKFSIGIPMGNQPFNRPFFGAGFGVFSKWVRFSPVIGVRYDKEVRTKTLAAGAAASSADLKLDQFTKRVAKLSVMITFSLRDARKVLGLDK